LIIEGRFVGYVLEQSRYTGTKIKIRDRPGAEAYINKNFETYSDRGHAIYKKKNVIITKHAGTYTLSKF